VAGSKNPLPLGMGSVKLGGKSMGYVECIEKAKTYIQEHISEKITIRELAEQAGYSLYHFCHVFVNMTGLSPGAYIRKVRLELAAENILNGESVTEVSGKYDFETPSGFAKAFRKYHGMSPTEYKMRGGRMKPEIKKLDAFTAVCYCLAKPEGEFKFLDHTAYWLGKDFSSVTLEEYQKLTYEGYAEIGVWLHPEEGSGELSYYFGPVVKSKDYIPAGMEVVEIPAAEFAVFTVPPAKDVVELHANIQKTWKEIYTEWLDSNGEWKYDQTKVNFEYYCGEDTCIYVPVCKA
jgi:AraC family transcriptional regulator